MKDNKQNSSTTIYKYVFAAILGAGAAWGISYWHFQKQIESFSSQIKPLRQKDNPYTFINPLLGYELPSDFKEFNQYQPLAKQVKSEINPQTYTGLENYSVYFRDLSLGRWIGINENSGYTPASMMKVAIMIAYLKESEANPNLLNSSLTYASSTATEINDVPFESPSTLKVGQSYSVLDLIQNMIASSDNGAKNLLIDHIDQTTLNDIYTDLGLPNPNSTTSYKISPKQYSVLLRILYNSTYLSRSSSELALKIMSQAKYPQGLAAGLPANTAVVQKWGENIDTAGNQNISLSNCGIIYYPNHPYILCVMTTGNNLIGLQKTIAAISKIAWQSVANYSKN